MNTTHYRRIVLASKLLFHFCTKVMMRYIIIGLPRQLNTNRQAQCEHSTTGSYQLRVHHIVLYVNYLLSFFSFMAFRRSQMYYYGHYTHKWYDMESLDCNAKF